MSLIEKIKSDHLAYRKLRDTTATTFLSTLIGEAEMIGKSGGNREVTNQEVIALVKKFIKNINETTAAIRATGKEPDTKFHDELFLSERYLPQQLSEVDLSKIIHDLFVITSVDERDNKITGKIMAYLKAYYNGQFDGSMASKIILDCRGSAVPV